MLYFSFNERPQEMFDRVVEIKVLNAKKVIRDALIGSFKVFTCATHTHTHTHTHPCTDTTYIHVHVCMYHHSCLLKLLYCC